MPIPIPENLYLRDPSNRAFVEGDSDKVWTKDTGLLESIFPAAVFIAVSLPVAVPLVRDLMSTSCQQPLTYACVIALYKSLMHGLFWILFSLAAAGLIIGRHIRDRATESRLQKLGKVLFGRVQFLEEREEVDSEGDKYPVLDVHYAFTANGEERTCTRTIARPGFLESGPSAGNSVAVLYVDAGLWELL